MRQSRISELERGKGEPTASQIADIAAVTGVSVEYLVLGREPPPALPPDEQFVLEVYRSLGLTRDQAVRGLSWASQQLGGRLEPEVTRVVEIRDQTGPSSLSGRSSKRSE